MHLIAILQERRQFRRQQEEMQAYLRGLDRINQNTKFIIRNSAEGLKSILKNKIAFMRDLNGLKKTGKSPRPVFLRAYRRFKAMFLSLDQVHQQTVFMKLPLARPHAAQLFRHAKNKENEEALRLLLDDRSLVYEFNEVAPADQMHQNLYHVCAKRNNFELMNLLCSSVCRADLEMEDLTGRTPLRWAYEHNSEPLVRVTLVHQLLLAMGARPFFPRASHRRAVEFETVNRLIDAAVLVVFAHQLHIAVRYNKRFAEKKLLWTLLLPFEDRFVHEQLAVLLLLKRTRRSCDAL